MGTYNRDISRLGAQVIQRDILLGRQLEDIFLLIGSSLCVLANMLAGNQMFDDAEEGRHLGSWIERITGLRWDITSGRNLI